MGKGTILDELGDGRYRVSIEMDEGGREAQKARLLLDISNLETQYDAAVLRVDEKKIALDQAADDYNAAIVTYNNTPQAEQDLATLEPYIPALQGAEYDYNLAVATATTIATQRASKIKEVEKIEATPPNPIVETTCIDGELEVTGDVGLIELAQEAIAGVDTTWVKPGFETKAQYDKATDGTLAWRAGQSPEQVYVNAALLPGVQKWRPSYRTGVITAIYDGDLCDVTLDSLPLSSARHMSINQTPDLQQVPVNYRECNADAFVVGDRVVVLFQNFRWESPQVIGFVENPRSCSTGILLSAVTLERPNPLSSFISWTGLKLLGVSPKMEAVDAPLTLFGGNRPWGIPPPWCGPGLSGSFMYGIKAQGAFGSSYDTAYMPKGVVLSYLSFRPFSMDDTHDRERMWGLAANEDELFVGLRRTPAATVLDLTQVAVYTPTGVLKHYIDLMDRPGAPYPTDDSEFGSGVSMAAVGDRLYISKPMSLGVSIVTSCIDTVSRTLLWEVTHPSAPGTFAHVSPGVDYIFVVDRAMNEVRMLRTFDGATIRMLTFDGYSPSGEFFVSSVAYTHRELYVAGHINAMPTLDNDNNPPHLLKYRFDSLKIPVFVESVPVNSLLGAPPQFLDLTETSRRIPWYRLQIYSDGLQTYRTAT